MELTILKYIQSISNPFLDVLFKIFTTIGEGNIIIILFILIYWTVDKRLGEYLGFSIFTSLLFNNFIKDIVKAERPIGKEGIRSLRIETATGASFPSGHSQTSANFYGSYAMYINRKIVYAISILLVILVGLSRLYLGVHYPKDVVFGILFGVLFSIICYKLFNKFQNKIKLYLIILIIFIPDLLINNSQDFLKSIGGYIGFILGIYLEKKYVNFSMHISFKRKFIRLVCGGIFIGSIYALLSLININSNYFYILKYGIVTFLGIYVYPWIFNKINL